MLVAAGLVACSSTPKPTVAEKVQSRQGSLLQSEELLSKAQSELKDFSARIQDLKQESDKRNNMVNKSRFETTLDHLQLGIQRSQLELRDLQARNDQRQRNLETRVNRALEPSAQPAFRDDEEVYEAD